VSIATARRPFQLVEPIAVVTYGLVDDLTSRPRESDKKAGARPARRRTRGAGVKHYHHHLVGDLALITSAQTCEPNQASA